MELKVKKISKIILFTTLFLILSNHTYAGQIVKVPKTGLTAAKPYIELLRAALKNTNYQTVQKSKDLMTEARYLSELESGDLDVAWSSTSKEKEKKYIPIYIPIEKGLLGYRLSIVQKGKEDAYANVKSLEDLQKLTFGQGIGWGDIKLYEASSIKVRAAPYDNLFQMVAAGRFDLYPRGLSEIYPEMKKFGSDNKIAVEKNIVIKYPWPYYFFVTKSKPKLAKALNESLNKMVENGSFEKLFNKNYGSMIEKFRLKERTIIEIKNPLITPNTPLQNKNLWYIP